MVVILGEAQDLGGGSRRSSKSRAKRRIPAGAARCRKLFCSLAVPPSDARREGCHFNTLIETLIELIELIESLVEVRGSPGQQENGD
jgi:hypothetical protein